MIRIFAGYDAREAVGYHVFCSSVIRNSTDPVAIHPLGLSLLRGYREKHIDGTNDFIYSRFLVPWLCSYEGWALFCDGADMLCRDDIGKLWDLKDSRHAIQVVQHSYTTTNPIKYKGTILENINQSYPKKNWSSVMLMNCEKLKMLTPKFVEKQAGSFLHRLEFTDEVGSLPETWNHLVGEQGFDPEAQLAHFTLGIPSFSYYKKCDYADEWREELSYVMHSG
jgi:hypothetical protein